MGVQGDAQYFQGLLGKIADKCKKTTVCPYCGAYNGPVRKLANARSIKIVHDKFRGKSKKGGAKEEWRKFEAKCKEAVDNNPDLAQYIGRAVEDLDPLRVKRLFESIPDEDLDLFWAKRGIGRPERFILSKMLVPPVCIRPSVPMQGAFRLLFSDLSFISACFALRAFTWDSRMNFLPLMCLSILKLSDSYSCTLMVWGELT